MFTFFTEQDIQIKYQLPTNSPGEAVEAEIIILWTIPIVYFIDKLTLRV